MMPILWTSLCILLQIVSANQLSDAGETTKEVICAYSDSGYVQNSEMLEGAPKGIILPDNKTMRCPLMSDDSGSGCFTFWNETMVFKQGCWICDSADCTGICENKNRRRDLLFCSCSGSMCNRNFSNPYNASWEEPAGPFVSPESHHYTQRNEGHMIIIIAIASVLSVALVIVFVYLVYRMFLMNRRRLPDSTTLIESPPPQPMFEADDLKLATLISKGRYGEVWKGLLNDTEVAVKVFTHAQRQYFNNERDIYSLPLLTHPSIVKCFGADERINITGNPEYILVLSYAPLGSLHSYLKNNVLDWAQLCNMSRSIAQGLAHLHTDVNHTDSFKPAIAHRDFNTRNVLVKPDLTCCITDMGFAIKIMGSKFIKNGQEENAEQSSLNDVGTLRYMSPEVLDGAVNLRDCESSLKQIDVYSLGLVLWELTTRTKELYPGSTVPEYSLPFQAELGLHPTIDEMQQLVSKNKQRPNLPRACYAVNSTQPHLQAIRALKETIEDCWDQDAEARLTSMCVEERISEMTTLWDSRSKGVTPTAINLTLSQAAPTTDSVINSTVNTIEEPEPFICRSTSDSDAAVLGQYNRMPRQRESMSTLTVETVLSPSTDGSERAETLPPNVSKDNVNLNYELAQKAFQPHQGRNPIVERNTHKKSDEELAVFNNTLMDAKLAAKHQADVEKRRQEQQQQHEQELQQQRNRRRNTDGADNTDMQNDTVSVHRNTPIPYLQNQVHEPSPPVVRPKVANVPGNGGGNSGAMASHFNECPDVKLQNTAKCRKNKDKGGILGFLSKNFKTHSNQNIDVGAVSNLVTANVHSRSNSDGQSANHSKRNVEKEEQRPLLTEVCVVNGSPIVRPATLNVNDNNCYREGKLGVAEVGVAKLQPARHLVTLPAKVRTRDNRAQSVTDLSPSGAQKAVRPSSLRLRGHNYKSDPQINQSSRSSAKDLLNGRERIQRRQKTPRIHGEGASRLSLHNGSAESVNSKSSSGMSLNRSKESTLNMEGTEMEILNSMDPSC